MVGEAPSPTLVEPVQPKQGRRKKGPDLGVLIDTTVVGLFGLVAVATGHEHWLKEREEIVPVTEPLKAWVDQLPAKTLKRLENNLAPALFCCGLAVVVGPDLILERRLRAHARYIARTGSQGQSDGPMQSFTDGIQTGHRNGSREPVSDWFGSIPPDPALNLGYDAG